MQNKKDQIDIIVVDDEPFIRRSLELVLKQRGYQVVIAEDGQVAWEKLLSGLIPQIMFVDLVMPRLSGFELSKLIKNHMRFKDIFLFMLTARWQEADQETAKAIGVDEYITKPFSPSHVIQRVQNILKERQGVTYG